MRSCVLGNGNLYLGFDSKAVAREMFWPVVGLLNHLAEGAENKSLLWYKGSFHEIGGENWHTQGRYDKGMCFNWRFSHKFLPLSVEISDCVDPYSPIWIRKMTVHCQDTEGLGFFFKQYYHLGENNIGESAFCDERTNRLYHYKGRHWVAISVSLHPTLNVADNNEVVRSCAVAKKRDGGIVFREETCGLLGRDVDHGLIESACGIKFAKTDGILLSNVGAIYALAFGKDREEADKNLDKGLELGFDGVRLRSVNYWNRKLPEYECGNLYSTSIKVIAAHCDKSGGILASCDTGIMHDYKDHYRYVWPRDAAMCSISLLKAGMPEYARRYLAFCVATLSKEGYFWQRYRPDGTRGSGWHSPNLPHGELPIQEDEVALSLVAALSYMEGTEDLDYMMQIYPSFVKKSANFMTEYRSCDGLFVKPSFDLWEERRGVFTFTQAASALALMAAARIAWVMREKDYIAYCEAALGMIDGLKRRLSQEELGFCRGLLVPSLEQDWTEDASLFMVPVMLNRICGICRKLPTLSAVKRIESLLKHLRPISYVTHARIQKALSVMGDKGHRGIARYTGDWYWRPEGHHQIPGNPWFVTTAWYLASGYLLNILGKEEIKTGLDWFYDNSLDSGILAEQVSGLTGEPLSVAPLPWSHSAYIDLIHLIDEKVTS